TGSGAGKTSITTGLLSRLSKSMKVQAFKVGPDFIDPMYHSLATGRPARNLDTFMMSKDTVKNLVGYASEGADICIVEGVRGLHEGLSGTSDECSTAEMAKLLRFPVILVVNARSITRSAAAMINGFKSLDPDVNIAGVIFNNVSNSQHERKLIEATEKYTDAEIVGMVRRDTKNTIGERHLGLKTINENGKKDIEPLEGMVSEIDTDRLLAIAESSEYHFEYTNPFAVHDSGLKAAVPMDDAYCFYYRENIECMKAAGMDVRTFSPLAGDSLPDADFYYLGGGYPELFLKELSENRDFMDGLKAASEDGRMILGECGGLMSLCASIEDKSGKYKMSGVFDAESKMCGRHGPTYVIADTTEHNPLFPKMTVRGHEFHYSEVLPKSDYHYGYSMNRGIGIDNKHDGLVFRRSLGSYVHQHALSVKDWLSKICL
ncbi:MAG: hydrogenobyrinic acid a,c-diamide synthase (glutamine-hydrolyzing), partial [Candidatus Methanomethylophilaceae archaeon]|nr:hydrogenobyrinic acid a,c-diamide synthase (glutamine-hydrolyzing) [Candidatus Methanomethylophilaceae archaeon]